MRRSSARALVAGAATLSVVLAGVTFAGAASAAARAKSTRTSLAAVQPTLGKAVTLTARVSPKPTRGTVRFTASGRTVTSCGARPVSRRTGKATCRTTFRTAGRRTIAARYSGASKRYQASRTTRSVTVHKAAVAPKAASVIGPLGSCTTTRGALVAVSFGHWSGPVVRVVPHRQPAVQQWRQVPDHRAGPVREHPANQRLLVVLARREGRQHLELQLQGR